MAITAGMPYEQLYVDYEPAARRLALTLVPPHAAEDVVAEAFTRVLDTAARNGPPEAFGPYLLRAVRNTALRYQSQGRRLVPVPDPEPAPADGPERIVSDREDARLAAAAFRQLPERWRQVLWATAVEEITIAVLANRWGMTANGVSQLASRAREGLRQAYLTEHLGAVTSRACREVAPYMGAAVRGRAGRRHQAQLAAHLRGCERCGQAYAGLGAINNHLGELLVPGALAGAGALLGHVLPAARAAARGSGWHTPLLTLGAVASAAGAVVTLQLATPAHPHSVAIPAAAAPAPSAPASVQVPGTGPAAAVPPPSSGGAGASAPATGAAGSIVTPVTAAAGQLAAGAGQAVGQAVAGTGRAAGQLVSGVTSAVPAASGAGQAAGGAVSNAAGTAGNLVQNVTGAAGGLLGGL